jgi:DNA-binding transcriptional ArsR family regulator
MAEIYSEENASVFLKVFGFSPQLRLLDFFMDNPNHDFTRNEIMEAIGMAKRTLYEHISTLLEEGAVKVSRKIGRAELYTLNIDSPIVKCFEKVEEELTKPREIPSEQTEEIQVLR